MRTFFTLLFLAPTLASAASIADLPELGQRITHHYSCTLLLVQGRAERNQQKTFEIDGQRSGQNGDANSITLGHENLVGSASNQMLGLKWTRDGKTIASGTTMIQVSDTQAYVLLLDDPEDADSQASISCTAVSFAAAKGGKS